jgi:hypothetical protein
MPLSGLRGKTNVIGPGQNCVANFVATAVHITSDFAALIELTCTISGLKLGRPLAAKIRATA